MTEVRDNVRYGHYKWQAEIDQHQTNAVALGGWRGPNGSAQNFLGD